MAYAIICLILLPLLAEAQRPLLSLTGTPKFLMLFDTHTSTSATGSCENLDGQVVEMMNAGRWAFEQLKSTGAMMHIPNAGMDIYDTCGSKKRTHEILQKALMPRKCPITDAISGIISFACPAVQNAIEEFVSLTGTVHIRLVDGLVSASSERSLRIPIVSSGAMQAMMAVIDSLGWRSIQTFIPGGKPAERQRDTFETVAANRGFCIQRQRVFDAASLPKSGFGNKGGNLTGSVIFTSGMRSDEIAGVVRMIKETGPINETQPVSFLIWNGEGDRMQNTPAIRGEAEQNRVIAIWDVLPPFPDMERYFSTKFSRDIVDNATKEYFLEHYQCNITSKEMGMPTCGRGTVVRDFGRSLGMASRWDIYSAIIAVAALADISTSLKIDNCAAFSMHLCAKPDPPPLPELVFLNPLSVQTVGDISVRLTKNSSVDIARGFPIGGFDKDNNLVELGKVETGIIKATDPNKLQEILNIHRKQTQAYSSNQHQLSCPAGRRRCNQIRIQQREPSLTHDGDVMLAGMFPVHTNLCRQVQPNGIMAAEAFIWAVSTFKDRHARFNTFPGVSLGAMALDSCQSATREKLMVDNFEKCLLTNQASKETGPVVEPSSVVGYMRYTDTTFPGSTLTQDKLDVTISPFAIYTDGILRGRPFAMTVVGILNKLRWTKVHCVWSKDFPSRQFHQEFLDTFQAMEIVVLTDEVISPTMKADPESLVKRWIKYARSSRAMLLLTNVAETRWIIEILASQTKETFGLFDFVFFPWNANLAVGAGHNITLGSVVLKYRHHEDHAFMNYWSYISHVGNPTNPWWREFTQLNTTCHAERNAKNRVMSTRCPARFQETDEMIGYVIKTADSILFSMNEVYKQHCADRGADCPILTDFIKFTNATISSLQLISMSDTVDDLKFSKTEQFSLPLGIHNVRLTEQKLSLTKAGEWPLFDRAVVLSYKPDLSTFLSHSDRPVWCPRCFRCLHATPAQNKFYYIPGDVILVGIFNTHNNGTGPFHCGPLSISGYIAAEAFLYSVQTYRDRYNSGYLANITVGVLIMDSCGDPLATLQDVTNFESCRDEYSAQDAAWPAHPRHVIGYVATDLMSVIRPLSEVLDGLRRPLVTTVPQLPNPIDDKNTQHMTLSTSAGNSNMVEVILDFMMQHNWTRMSLVASQEYQNSANQLSKHAGRRGICVSNIYYMKYHDLMSVESVVGRIIEQTDVGVLVTYLDAIESVDFFTAVEDNNLRRVWINAGDYTGWVGVAKIAALGAIFVTKEEDYHHGFQEYFSNVTTKNPSPLPWFHEYLEPIANCLTSASQNDREPATCSRKKIAEKMLTSPNLHRVIEATDSLLHGFHDLYSYLCPAKDGICQKFAEKESHEIEELLFETTKRTSFHSEGALVSFDSYGKMEDVGRYVITNYQGHSHFVQVADWYNGEFTMKNERVMLFDKSGLELTEMPKSVCGIKCKCVNLDIPEEVTESPSVMILPNAASHSGVFIDHTWAIVIVVLGGSGIICAVALFCYIMAKVLKGALRGKNVGLGLLLLLAIVCVYLSVLFFVFTPSEVVCGFRYFAPGVSCGFCFSVILVKLMNLHEYRSIGPGGNVSRLNNFLYVFLISGIQIAISTQWWILKSPMLCDKTVCPLYACNFERNNFLFGLVYIMFLILLCGFYSIGVRQVTRNLGEARPILLSMWCCIGIWVTWIVVAFVTPRYYLELTICIALLLTASVLFSVIFIPKVQRIAKSTYKLTRKCCQGSGNNLNDTGNSTPHCTFQPAMDFSFFRMYSSTGDADGEPSLENISKNNGVMTRPDPLY